MSDTSSNATTIAQAKIAQLQRPPLRTFSCPSKTPPSVVQAVCSSGQFSIAASIERIMPLLIAAGEPSSSASRHATHLFCLIRNAFSEAYTMGPLKPSSSSVDEETISGFMAARLGKFLDASPLLNSLRDPHPHSSEFQPILCVANIAPGPGLGKVDVSGFAESSNPILASLHASSSSVIAQAKGMAPLFFCKNVLNKTKTSIISKRSQALAYAANMYDSFNPTPSQTFALIGLIIGIGDNLEPGAEVHFYGQGPDGKLVDVPFWAESTLSEGGTASLLSIIERFCYLQLRRGFSRFCFPGVVGQSPFCFEDLLEQDPGESKCEYMYKVYDYRPAVRGYEVPQADRRSADDIHRIPGARVVLSSPDLKIASYPRIAGDHLPEDALQWLAVWRTLLPLWKAKRAHADIRLANLLFFPRGAVVIDYDFAGEAGERLYPSNFAGMVPDTRRHPEADAESAIRVQHDLFSFACLLSFFEPADSSRTESWAKLHSQLSQASFYADAELFSALDELDEIVSACCSVVGGLRVKEKYKEKLSSVTKLAATGTPPRPQLERKRKDSYEKSEEASDDDDDDDDDYHPKSFQESKVPVRPLPARSRKALKMEVSSSSAIQTEERQGGDDNEKGNKRGRKRSRGPHKSN